MALDEVLAREVAAGRRPPTLRIWEWAVPAVIIGSFQSLRNEVDMNEGRKLGITVVRRISGGRAMLAEPSPTPVRAGVADRGHVLRGVLRLPGRLGDRRAGWGPRH